MLFLLDAPIGGGASGAPALDARSHREELIIAAGFAGCKETYDTVVQFQNGAGTLAAFPSFAKRQPKWLLLALV